MHDFGYVALNMKYVNPEDSGTYTCRAVNDLGEAVTSATLFVQCKYYPRPFAILFHYFCCSRIVRTFYTPSEALYRKALSNAVKVSN